MDSVVVPLLVPTVEEVKCCFSQSALEKVLPEVTDCRMEVTFLDDEDIRTELIELKVFDAEFLSSFVPGNDCETLVLDFGGVRNLLPTPRLEKRFDVCEIVAGARAEKEFAFSVLGAGAGPHWLNDGQNSEKVEAINCISKDGGTRVVCDRSRLGMHSVSDGNPICIKSEQLTTPFGSHFSLMGNCGVFTSIPIQGRHEMDVSNWLAIDLTFRQPADQTSTVPAFVDILKALLRANFPMTDGEARPRNIALVGCFVQKTAAAKMHVMRQFSKTPLESAEAVDDWLRFYDMNGPLALFGTIVLDLEGCPEESNTHTTLNCRWEHFHGFQINDQGAGHYHHHVTTNGNETVTIRAYFKFANQLCRVNNTIQTL